MDQPSSLVRSEEVEKMAFLIGTTASPIQRLAVPAVCLLIAFLAYASQWLFAHAPDLSPGPLTPTETYVFNALLCCLWYTYYKAVTVDPGRYEFPASMRKKADPDPNADDDYNHHSHTAAEATLAALRRRRWCRKCALPKPPRAHHCKTCGRCIPKMDHHCPWTGNCVSLQTFPHFLRFLAYTNASLWTLLSFLLRRAHGLWAARHLPAYLGPTLGQLALLTVLLLVAGVTALMLVLLFATTLKGWAFNTTMIEGWEIERHEAVLERRAGYGDGDDGGWWRGSGDSGYDGETAGLGPEPVEFPYDIGIFANMAQAMGTANPLLWLLPFASGPRVGPFPGGPAGNDEKWDTKKTSNSSSRGDSAKVAAAALIGWEYEENGLNDREGMWPPVDPDKVRHARVWRERERDLDAQNTADRETRRRRQQQWERQQREQLGGAPWTVMSGSDDKGAIDEDEREVFRRRQERDLRRWQGTRSRIMDELEEVRDYDYEEGDQDYDFVDEAYERGARDYRNDDSNYPRAAGRGGLVRPRPAGIIVDEGKSGWVNADGEQLGDYGVDEDAEFDDPAYGDHVDRRYPEEVGNNNHNNEEEDEVPLAELIRRRKVLTRDNGDT
ncbi:DHHC palmitoyltransferase-domain-containing protein [Biscogniauxia marginata]|nr:DHHC palmitoyltransferase-domain-containing protein [Biscogniauxia marginata]